MTRDEIDLPAPSARATVTGISGEEYTGEASGERATLKVLSRSWMDRQRAVLELENGRKIAVVLVAHTSVDEINGVDGVLLIEGDDPEVANMNVNEVLDQLRLDGKWLRWIKHWEDDVLRREACDVAVHSARDATDEAPAELVFPEGLTQLQKSETVLHWALKEALSRVGTLFVPAQTQYVQAMGTGGHYQSASWTIPAARLQISNIRLEHRMKGLVPDVVCSARDLEGHFGHPRLLIEVAVTHRVDSLKRQKIIDAGCACLELDASKLARAGRVHRSDLPRILSTGQGLNWVHHDEIERIRSDAVASLKARLDEQLRAEEAQQEQLREAKLNRELHAMLGNLSIGQLYASLLSCLESSWAGEPDGFTRFNGWGLKTHVVISAIQRLRPGFEYAPGLMNLDGALRTLMMLEDQSKEDDRTEFIVGEIRRFSISDETYTRFITLLLLATKTGLVNIEQHVYHGIARSLEASTLKRMGGYARPIKYDEFVMHVIPRMSGVLSERKRKQIEKKQFQEAVEIRAKKIYMEQRQRQEAQAEEIRRVEERRRLVSQFATGAWSEFDGMPIDEGQALQLSKTERVRYVDRAAIIGKAWRARERGISLYSFYDGLGIEVAPVYAEVSRLLKASYLQV